MRCKNNVIVISVHPDDETLGCGGSILKHRHKGDHVFWIICTAIHENQGWNADKVKRRDQEIKTVANAYGFTNTYQLELPNARLDQVPTRDLIQKISNIINDIKPNIMYLVNRSDIHSDHKIVFQAVLSCTKNFRYPFITRILMYECLSETEFSPALSENTFIPNVFIDISDFMDQKLEIMKIYKSEIMEHNLPRSISAIKALATYRGSRIGVQYAESFQLIFEKS
jgi:N-acetylglucosamine malate deacetylase 1